MQDYTDSARVSSVARPVDSQTSASAQIGEAPTSEASNMTRTGAAVRLDMEAAAAALPDGLSSVRSGQDASFDVGALGHDGAAQNVPGSVAEVGREGGTDECSKTPMLHASPCRRCLHAALPGPLPRLLHAQRVHLPSAAACPHPPGELRVHLIRPQHLFITQRHRAAMQRAGTPFRWRYAGCGPPLLRPSSSSFSSCCCCCCHLLPSRF